jgi:RimJ/RimL family protein N-acetyltransferase
LPACSDGIIVAFVAAMQHRLVTERLVLRRWRAEDVEPYAAMCADPEVMRWIGDGSTLGLDECRRAVERFELLWAQNGFGLFALEEKASAQLIGFVGLAIPTFLPEILPAIEIGWRLARHAWGKGFATEAARAALAFGFGRPELDRIVSIHQRGNIASGRIMQKLGMRLERDTVHPTWKRPIVVYDINRAQWKRQHSSPA